MKNKIKIVIALALLAVIVTCGAWACNTHERDEFAYTVKPGDTLWSIAVKHSPDGADVCRYIFDIQQDNELDGCTIRPGDVLILR